jgi:phosphatidate cytidylyltransferase
VDRRRVYAALVFFPCFYVLVRFLHPIAFLLFVIAGILIAQYEYYRLYFSEQRGPTIGLGLGLGLLSVLSFAMPAYLPSQGVATGIVGAILVSQLLTRSDLKTRLLDSAVLAFGVFYIAWLLGHLIAIRQLEDGASLIFFLFLVTWANDTAAYYVGRTWGRHLLAPIISPNKTWEGAVGGMVGSIAAALICHAWFLPSLTVMQAFGVSLLLGIAGPLGDLCESVLKRSAGVKDSGALIPGHGGVLDRVDSLIFTTPAFYYCLLALRTS